MSNDPKVFILYSCNLHKERASMSVKAVSDDRETFYAAIGDEILQEHMDFKGFSGQKGFDGFREEVVRGNVSSVHLDYGYVEEYELVNLTDHSQACEWLRMDDSEYKAIRNGEILQKVEPERLRQILGRALSAIAIDYRGAELYEYLHNSLEMRDDEIARSGINLSEFYADYEPDTAMEDDYGQEH